MPTMRQIEEGVIERMVLDRIRIGLKHVISQEQLESADLHIAYDLFIQGVVHSFEARLLANNVWKDESEETEEHSTPASWWDHLKQTWNVHWCPRSWQKRGWVKLNVTLRHERVPVRHTTNHYMVCPHLQIRARNEEMQHLLWMQDKLPWMNKDDDDGSRV